MLPINFIKRNDPYLEDDGGKRSVEHEGDVKDYFEKYHTKSETVSEMMKTLGDMESIRNSEINKNVSSSDSDSDDSSGSSDSSSSNDNIKKSNIVIKDLMKKSLVDPLKVKTDLQLLKSQALIKIKMKEMMVKKMRDHAKKVEKKVEEAKKSDAVEAKENSAEEE